VREGQRIRYLVDSLAQTLESARVAIITLAMHESSREIVRKVRQRLWDDALATLTERGLLLIDISNPDAIPGDASLWPPPADVDFDLPERFDDPASASARGDLREVALTEGVFDSKAAADAFALTLIASSRAVRELHARLALTLARLQRDSD